MLGLGFRVRSRARVWDIAGASARHEASPSARVRARLKGCGLGL